MNFSLKAFLDDDRRASAVVPDRRHQPPPPLESFADFEARRTPVGASPEFRPPHRIKSPLGLP